MHDVFTRFAIAWVVIGDALTVKDMLALIEFGSQERVGLLERRETGMRLPPLLHVVLQPVHHFSDSDYEQSMKRRLCFK